MNQFCSNVCPVKVRAKKNAKSNDTKGALLPHPRQEQRQGKSKLDNKLLLLISSNKKEILKYVDGYQLPLQAWHTQN